MAVFTVYQILKSNDGVYEKGVVDGKSSGFGVCLLCFPRSSHHQGHGGQRISSSSGRQDHIRGNGQRSSPVSGKEQWELIGMVDRYAFFRKEAEYFAGDRGSQSTSMIYSQKAKSLRKEIKKRFGHVLKK
jgi:hypothetical protein